jgi:hypothetical protein
MKMRLLLATFAIIAAGCGKKEKEAAAAAAASDAPASAAVEATAPAADEEPALIAPRREPIDRNALHPELKTEFKIGGSEGRSPFVGDRVIGLNAIVQRSLDVSREYDKLAPGIRAVVEKAVSASGTAADRAAAADAVKSIEAMHEAAKAAYDDMAKAKEDLLASGEYYDEGIFAGMAKFVGQIEKETRDEVAALSAKLDA